jgi:hypothetical protein
MSLYQALGVLEQMPEAPVFKPRSFEPPPGHCPCACGKKFIALSAIKFHNTKLIQGVTDSICDDCERNVKNFAIVVCIKCKSVVARMQPNVFRTGFVVRAGEYYHTNACPNCVKNLNSSILIEKYFYEKENGFAVKELKCY